MIEILLGLYCIVSTFGMYMLFERIVFWKSQYKHWHEIANGAINLANEYIRRSNRG